MRRTAGITHITLFTEPAPCGGECLYCPTIPGQPRSYLPHADVSRFGLTHDAGTQMRYWLNGPRSSHAIGSKIELLLLGGSFLAHPIEYQETFLAGVYRAVTGLADSTVPIEELIAHHARDAGPRLIGITIEARPDQVTEADLARLFRLGVTKIEIGAQSLDDRVLSLNDRGHAASATATAVTTIRRAGLKVGAHLLLGLPGASFESDLESARRLLLDPAVTPDHLKVYFCEFFRREFMRPRLVEHVDAGAWRPLDHPERLALLERIIPIVPSRLRISRIGRKHADDELDRPARRMTRGDAERHFGCRCVRCREPRPNSAWNGEMRLVEERISEEEWHLEARTLDSDVCLGLLRLHVESGGAIVRELHVYGIETPLGERGPHQHRGVGKRLMALAEDRTRSAGASRLLVASGTGVRSYYEKLGYKLDFGDFMTKLI
jgi:elongator complex protein 3